MLLSQEIGLNFLLDSLGTTTATGQDVVENVLADADMGSEYRDGKGVLLHLLQ